MDLGEFFLWTAVLTAVGSVAFSCLFLYARVPQFKRLSRLLLMVSFLLVTATFLLLVYYFQTSNFAIDYVVRHSKADYDAFYKLAGVWSGGKGSLLLWTWFIGISLAIEEGLQWRKHKRFGGSEEREVYDWARLIASLVLVAMLYLLIDLDLFQKTDPTLLASAMGRSGLGLNPLLETPMVIIHPPMEFAGYALTTLPFAAALAFLMTEDPAWTDTSLQWARMAWLFYTVAILLGGIWAYTVLGWGGYWAWDPVETSNLIPWIVLTALLHAQLYHRQRRKFIWLTPLLAIMAFVLTVFATFETRTGYVDSVHTFTFVGAGGALPATEKLLLVMAQEPSGPFLMTLILAPLLAGGLLLVWRFAQIRKAEAEGGTPTHIWFAYGYVPFLAALLLWVLWDVSGFLSTVFDVGKVLGGGNAELGTVLLATIVAGLPVAWVLLTSSEEAAPSLRKGLVNDDSTMTVAVSLFSLWFFVTLMLMLVGVNSLDPAVFESRFPLLVLPLGLTLIAALTWRELGTEKVLILVAVLVVLTVLAYVLLEPSQFWLYVPITAAALGVAVYRIAKSLDSRRTPRGLRIAGLMLLGSG
ncbi:MAG: cytochrome c biogenesis protein CcsA, partial [Thermoplasmata archaeon]